MKNFEIPELNVIRYESTDVITTSTLGGNDVIDGLPEDPF